MLPIWCLNWYQSILVFNYKIENMLDTVKWITIESEWVTILVNKPDILLVENVKKQSFIDRTFN